MSKHPLLQVDAFTDTPLGGNACAIVFDAGELTEAAMLAVAREMNLSETAFVSTASNGNFRARYFTPAEEIPLAGHPTIATVFALVETGRLTVAGDYLKIPLELRDGPIDVEIWMKGSRVDQVVMSQRKPVFHDTYDPARVMPVFGLDEPDLLPGTVIQTVSTGTPQLMIPVRNLEAVKKAQIDIGKYISLRAYGDFFSTHIFCLEGVEYGDTFARHFVTPPDLIEDPFTGSATGGMGAYLWHYQLITKPDFVAEQGHWMGRPGQASVQVIGSPDNIDTVKVGGRAVTVFQGELSL
ncbi:MAG: PhzF family phenazine biosynthesis protein [Anaerolineales bacterium]|nr:PhzF family phenazine biosynthesis protein [Anaerolineales bacterium]